MINYTDAETPYTRVIEHKHFEFGKGDPDKTIITREYPADWHKGDEPYYPVNNDRNNDLYAQYKEMADKEDAKASAAAWVSTSTTTWTRSSRLLWKLLMMNSVSNRACC